MTTKTLSIKEQNAKKEAKKVQELKALLNTNMNTVIGCLGTEERARQFLAGAIICVQNNPALLDCDQGSLRAAIMKCSAIGLIPGCGDCCLIPFKGMVQFQLEYKGIKTLCYRSGVQYVDMNIVYKGDDFDYALGLDPFLKHVPCGETDEPIKTYAVAKFNNEKLFRVMEKKQVIKIRNMAPAFKYADTEEKRKKVNSAWNKDPMFWMWQKTVFKQLSKLLPTSEQLKQAIHLDNVSERGGFIDSDGTVVEEPFQNQRSSVEEIKPIPLAEKFNAKKKELHNPYAKQIENCKSLDELSDILLSLKKDEEMTDGESEMLHEMADEKQKLLN